MDEAGEETLLAEGKAESHPAEAGAMSGGGVSALVRRYLTPRLGAAILLWRLEAWLATPIALALVVALGRWPGALAMGAVMAVFAFSFLFLLQGERVIHDLPAWAYRRRTLRRYLQPIAERRGRVGALIRVLAVPLVVMFTGPFWRAVVLLLFGAGRIPAYAISVAGSVPHSLLWYGLVLGGIWEGLFWPFLDSRGF